MDGSAMQNDVASYMAFVRAHEDVEQALVQLPYEHQEHLLLFFLAKFRRDHGTRQVIAMREEHEARLGRHEFDRDRRRRQRIPAGSPKAPDETIMDKIVTALRAHAGSMRLGPLAKMIYGDDTARTRNNLRTSLVSLKKLGRVRNPTRGEWQAVGA